MNELYTDKKKFIVSIACPNCKTELKIDKNSIDEAGYTKYCPKKDCNYRKRKYFTGN